MLHQEVAMADKNSPPTGIIDSHAHIDFPQYSDDRDAMIDRMTDAGVGGVICIGTRLTHADQPQKMAELYENVWFTVGVHPNHAHDQPDATKPEIYRSRIEHPKCVGIGEAGLDYFHNKAEPEVQKSAFQTQLELALETGLPIVIHSRDADQDMAEMLEQAAGEGQLNGVMHCFSSGAELAERALKIGFYISFSGILTFNRSDTLRKLAAEVPKERLLVETDAPYLSPHPMRHIKRNEPALVRHTLECLAGLHDMSVAEMTAITNSNTQKLFSRIAGSQTSPANGALS